jgi:hypothetical protein
MPSQCLSYPRGEWSFIAALMPKDGLSPPYTVRQRTD